jgi:polysaccharide biosynthesis/export protein
MTKSSKFNSFGLYLAILIMTILLYSCIPQTKLEYLQNPIAEKNTYKLHEKAVDRIKPNDELYIRVSSFDEVAFNFFSTQSNTNYMNYSNDVSLSLISYIVNDSGCINFPILGPVYFANLTIDEAIDKLKTQLSEYFNQPSVIMKLVNKRINVLGEVAHAGTYIYTNNQLNLFEALSLAGNATVHGNIKEVYLIRSVNDSIFKTKLNLTKDDILYSEYYYVQPNDILYVKPRTSVKWNIISTPISLALTSVTTALLILSFFRY